MRKLIMTGCAIAFAASTILPVRGAIICSGESAAVRVKSPAPTTVNKTLTIYANPDLPNGTDVSVAIDGTIAFSTTNRGETAWKWQPLTTGNHTLKCTFGTNVLTKTLNVTALDFYVTPAPKPPMGKNNNISITPTTRNFGVNGGGNAIITSGSGTWTAAVSDPWITLNTTSGNVGYPVAYTVSANTNVEQRTGYVYVSGWTHTVTQDGVGGTISPGNREFEHQGGNGTITVSAANKMVWQARPNVDWINVSPTSGMGEGRVSYNVAKYDEVATRQGTITAAGNTFTVFQYGRRMKLSTYKEARDYEPHVIPITVNALAITQWSVTPNNSWISVVDAGNGQGGDLVSVAISENPSYKARTGTVKIGTETFTVTQQGRPKAALSFNVSPANSTASVNGANGMIAVTATPDLPWTATSGANWITIYAATANGAGNGNVVYNASPNPTLSQRTGKVTVTPEAASGMAAKMHTVTQPAATSALSLNGYEFEASGESCSVEVSVANIVQWSVSESLDWITVNGSTSRTGPGTVVLQAAANDTVYPRSGTVKIAGKNFSVSQKARGVELEYDTKLFGTDGGYESISIHPDGNSAWTAVASDATWITIFQGDSGTGDGEILYIVSPYVGTGAARTGWITVGSQKVYITQRAYDLNIEPNGTNVVGNAGAGEFGVSADIKDVWTAIVTEPWITLVSGYDAGTGSGVVRFLYTENTTGKTRTGKIIVAGEVYTLEQRARQMVAITATAEHGGSVSGGGSYDLGTRVTLEAVPDSGYRFAYWTGAASSMQNPLAVTAETAQSYTAVFEPLPIAFTSVTSGEDGVSLAWNNLAWAATYRICRGVTSVPSSATVVAELPNDGNCTYLDASGDVDVEYWYWIEAEGPSDEVMSDPMTGKRLKPIVISPIAYTNLRGASNPNPATYQEGTLVTFANPGAVTGYTFAGWTPAQITADMTGAQTVRAAWTANGYAIAYDPNGGSGTMEATAATYDAEVIVSANGFTRTGYRFMGWATDAAGEVIYAADQPVTNLTAQSGGVVTLYAVWEEIRWPITYTNLRGASNPNPATYREGTPVTFASPGAVTGYTFAGWTPARITADMTGAQTVRATWTANSYSIVYDPNGGSGTMEATAATYDAEATVAVNGFTRTGYRFMGWATDAAGEVVYAADQPVTNLTAQSGGVVTLYAVWEEIPGPRFYIDQNGVLTNVDLNGFADIAIPDGVTGIGGTAFGMWCYGMTNVTIPASVTDISVPAFSECFDLLAINVDAENANYKSENGLLLSKDGKDLVAGVRGAVAIPDGVTSICAGAFYGRPPAIQTLPDSLTYIGDSAFWGGGWSGDLVIPENVTRIEGTAFMYCALRNVTIPRSVTDIGIYAFDGCGVTSVTIGDGVTHIGWRIDAQDLQELSLPATLKGVVTKENVGEIFLGCSPDVTITYRDEIEGPKFYVDANGVLTNVDLRGYVDIVIPGDVTGIGARVFASNTELRSVVIPDSVTSVGDKAFELCRNLTNATLSANVTVIKPAAFSGCTSLMGITLPDGVTSLGNYAFCNCRTLTDVTVPASVTSLGVQSFRDCRNLTNVVFNGNAPAVGSDSFASVGAGCTAYVRKGSTGWGVEIPGTWNGLNIRYVTSETGLAAWLAERNLSADTKAANGRTAAECYALGLDPADALDDFRIVSIELTADGPKVEWTPKTNRWTGKALDATLKGAATLGGDWKPVEEATPAEKAAMRFFKVVVEGP